MNVASERIRTGAVPVETWSPASAREDVFRYVDISSVDRKSKSVTGATELAVEDAPSRARQLLKADDVLVSTVRPNLNAVAMVPSEFDGAIGSTGFTVLRANPRQLLPRYLFHWVRTPMFVADMVKKATGASYPAVSDRIVLDSEIPKPPLAEQRRIADLLDKADTIRRKRKEAIALTEELLRSAFLEMFGDPVTNPKGWPVKSLGELLAQPLRNGLSPSSGGKFEAAVLTLSAITRGQFDASAYKLGAFAVEPWEDIRVDARDFLICRGNGNVALVGTAAFSPKSMKSMVFPDTIIAARVDLARIRPAFLNTIWKSPFIRRQIEAGARTTNGTFKINQTVVEGISVMLPPPDKQQVFADLEARVVKNAENQQAAIERAEDLFNSLVARVFSGALGASR